MKVCQNGITRIVFLIGRYAIKIPNFRYQHNHFLQGCYANWSERYYTKIFKNTPEHYSKIAPTIFCTYFGLLSIQKRADVLNRELTDKEVESFKGLTTDIKSDNFGLLNGKLVCVDYV